MAFVHRIITATAALAIAGGCIQAHADPAPFPDLDGYTPVEKSDYAVQLKSYPHNPDDAVYFLTPDGIPCNFHAGAVICIGNIPGVADKDKNPYTSVSTDAGIQPAATTPYDNGTVQGLPIKTLAPFQSITNEAVTCGVDNGGLTACKGHGDRGFVISPQGTGWLPHV
ncbi:MAG: hypothetical protein ACRDTV_22715 [Mycobacterium sp.]